MCVIYGTDHHPSQPIETDRDFTIICRRVNEIFQIVVIAWNPDRKRKILKHSLHYIVILYRAIHRAHVRPIFFPFMMVNLLKF